MSKVIISTWMYSAPEEEVSLHHQVGSAIGKQKIKNIYWRCCINFFRSVHVSNPEAVCYLFCNELPPVEIDGQKVREILDSFGVEVKILQNVTRPPEGYYGAWGTQFIVFDILEEFQSLSNAEDAVMILDSDCLLTEKVPSRFIEKLLTHKALLYTLEGSWETNNNGITNKQLTQLSHKYSPPSVKKEVFYTGGEIICLLGSEISKVCEIGRNAYQQSLKRSMDGKPKFNEEAHLLSYVYGVLNYADWTANEFIQRMWTDPFIYRTCYQNEKDLLIWHLPAEKKTSMKSLFALGGKGNDLMRDKKAFAQFMHVDRGRGFWTHFCLRAVARFIIRLVRKVRAK